jgi:phosphoenolpyruvate carboxykinase (ATP)
MDEHDSKAYLVNTGWIGGKYGVGQRIPLKENRLILDHIFDGKIEDAEFETMPIFNLDIPKSLPDINSKILNPRINWKDKNEYDATANRLAQMFVDNFKRFSNTAEGKALAGVGPEAVHSR